MESLNSSELHDCLNWRYATKRFDPCRTIDSDDWEVLEEALLLTPSSFGLQPWKFVVVTDRGTKKNLAMSSMGQPQVMDCSHLVVFARKNLSQKDVDAYLDRIVQVRGVTPESLAGFRGMMIASLFKRIDAGRRNEWATRQIYLALGNFLTAAAILGIDTCPMEGIEPDEYDRILNLRNQGLNTVVVCAAGHRDAGDAYAALKKVRFPKEQVFMEIRPNSTSSPTARQTGARRQLIPNAVKKATNDCGNSLECDPRSKKCENRPSGLIGLAAARVK